MVGCQKSMVSSFGSTNTTSRSAPTSTKGQNNIPFGEHHQERIPKGGDRIRKKILLGRVTMLRGIRLTLIFSDIKRAGSWEIRGSSTRERLVSRFFGFFGKEFSEGVQNQ